MSRLTRFFKSVSNAGREKKAVALLYSDLKTPVLMAKGENQLAWEIIESAQKNGVLVAEDPVLAETLSYLELNQEIPEEVFQSVAVILSWVYWVKGKHPD